MGLLSYFGAKFYKAVDERTPVAIGRLAWVPVPHLPRTPQVLEAVRMVSTDHKSAQVTLQTLNDTHFTRRSNNSLPVLALKLGETEELLALKAKRRPAVVVGMGAIAARDAKAEHHRECRIAVVPFFGVQSEDDVSGFSIELAKRVRYLHYPQFFPMAEWTETRQGVVGRTNLKEGVARFDRIQFVNNHPPGFRSIPLELQAEPLECLQSCLAAYLGVAPRDEILLLRDVLHEELPPN